MAYPFVGLIEVLEDLAPLWLIAFAAYFCVRKPVAFDLGLLFRVVSVILIGVLVVALIERAFFHELWRPRLLFGTQLNFTPTLILPALLVTYVSLADKLYWKVIGLLAFGSVVFLIAGVSLTRGPQVVLAGLVVLRILLVMASGQKLSARFALSGSIAAVFLFATILALGNASALHRLNQLISGTTAIFQQASEGDSKAFIPSATDNWIESVPERFIMTIGGLEAFLQRPIFGYGAQDRFAAAVEYFDPPLGNTYTHLHNDFVTHLVAGGIIGLGLFCLLLLTPIYVLFRGKIVSRLRRELAVLASLVFGGVALVNNILFVWATAYILALSMVAVVCLIDSKDRKK
jgi:O-antigen ligase